MLRDCCRGKTSHGPHFISNRCCQLRNGEVNAKTLEFVATWLQVLIRLGDRLLAQPQQLEARAAALLKLVDVADRAVVEARKVQPYSPSTHVSQAKLIKGRWSVVVPLLAATLQGQKG